MRKLTSERKRQYEEISAKIGRTPIEEYREYIPNCNKIVLKRECDNPFGSHYDRVYLELFRDFEERGKISIGSKVLETTSGAAGVSFAGIGKLLGFDCYVALPAGGEHAREQAIRKYLVANDHLIFTPSDAYISGFPIFLKEFLSNNRKFTFLNHSMGRRNKQTGKIEDNEITLRALEGIVSEVLAKINIDFFVPAIGNGSSVLGPGRKLSKSTKVIAFETFQSAAAYEQIYPGDYQARFGIKPGLLSRHRLPGTSYQGINFPHIRSSIERGIIDKVVLVSDRKMDEEYKSITGKDLTLELPHWDSKNIENHEDVGRTTRAGIAVALSEAKNVRDKTFLVIAYDKSCRYDS